jgi:hypothetical protein
MIQELNNYCLYRHIRLDKNEVFYIGISSNKKRPFSRFSRNKYWNNIIKITDWKVEIVIDNLSRKEIEEKEIEFIKLYGRKDLGLGTLCNLTDGGTGGLGLKHTEIVKNKMKGRKSYNKGISKWNLLENDIIRDIEYGFSENYIKNKYNCSNGSIWRIKRKLKQIDNDDTKIK